MHRFLPFRLLSGLSYIPENYRYLAPRIAVVLLVVAIASPWLWDLWLRFTASRQPFSIQKLRAISPEAATRLNSHCQQKTMAISPTMETTYRHTAHFFLTAGYRAMRG